MLNYQHICCKSSIRFRSVFTGDCVRLRLLSVSTLLGLTLAARGKAQERGLPVGIGASHDMDSVFQQMGERFIADGRSDGLSIAVVRDGKAHFYNMGVTSRDRGQRPSEHTVYEIGSISKAFTSLLLAHAVSEGRVHLDNDIRTYLPGRYPSLEFDGTPVHLVDLVDHTSALPDNLPEPAAELRQMKPYDVAVLVNEILERYTVSDMLHDLSLSKLTRRPGTEPRHSNVSMEVLAVILERVYHDSYPHLLSRYIEQPYAMASGVGYARRHFFATGYDEHQQAMPFFTGKIVVPAGGLRYSAQDMARFIEAQLQASDTAVRLSHQVEWGKENQGGFAFDWYEDREIDSQLHLRSSGGTFAFSSYIEMYPDQGYGVVLLANRLTYSGNTQGDLQQLASAARDAIWGAPAAQTALESELEQSHFRDVAATVALVHSAHPELHLTEDYVNAWGYRVLGAKRFDAAIALFQYNVARFPESWNAWDSLAEGYERSGDSQKAIVNYRHSLALDSTNTHATDALKRLNAAQ